MSTSAWRIEFANLREKQSRRDVTSVAALRLSLAEIWHLLRTCPDDVVIAYRQTPDDELDAFAVLQREAIDTGKIDWTAGASDAEIAIAIGGQLRALDAVLADRPRFAQPPAGANAYLCKEVDAYVIPRAVPKHNDGRTGPGRGFGRRGIPHHRILPHRIGDYEVQLVWRPQLSAGAVGGATRGLAAALFPGMTLERDPAHEPSWVALSADCPNEDSIIAAQVAKCFDEGALAMVYPELSMPGERRALVAAALRARSADMEVGKGPALVAAGSWHERDDGTIRNVMRILDKSGVEHMRYAKSSAYFSDGLREGIAVDKTIPVLVNADFLATFGICLDFCERELGTPYNDLDVDLILVSSHGNATTMKGHEANAGDFHTRLGGSAFVVQHSEKVTKPAGYVYPAEPGASGLGEDRAFSTRNVQFN